MADRPRDAVAPLRRALTGQFDDLVAQAASAGASDVYVATNLSHGLPVAATCIATVIARPLPDDVPADVLADALTGDPSDIPCVVTVADTSCPTTTRRRPATPSVDQDADIGPTTGADIGADADPDDLIAALPATELDVYIPFPDRTRTLLLTFNTAVPEPAQEAMLGLFHAIAEPLRWTWTLPRRDPNERPDAEPFRVNRAIR